MFRGTQIEKQAFNASYPLLDILIYLCLLRAVTRKVTSLARDRPMPARASRKRSSGAWIAVALLSYTVASAQTPPDAGAIRQQLEQQRRAPAPKETAPQFAPPPAMESIGGDTITVREFRFTGNSLLTDRQLTPDVAGFVGKPIDLAGLQNAAIAVANAYRHAGWIVRAYVPQQKISNNVVVIQIIEARLGTVRVDGEAPRVSGSRLRRMVEAAQKPGELLNANALDRSLLLINDLPGVVATGRLAPGQEHAQTDLVIEVVDGALVNGSLSADDAGSRFTGPERVIAMASLNDRLGIGDRADALLLHSSGADYLSLAYALPIGVRGWRAGMNVSHLNYDIVTDEFAELDPHGSSNTVGIEASYPLLRSRLKSVYFTFEADQQRFDNKSGAETTTDYAVQSASFGLSSNLFDKFLGGGATTAGIAIVVGKVDLSGSPNESADSLTTRTDGNFGKLHYSASRLQALTNRISLSADLRGQIANKNLDSSEKLYLGGSQGVRAYPQDEAGGSEGMLATLEARFRLTASLGIAGFGDWGRVSINHDNDFAGAATRNDVTLKGAGAALNWATKFGLNLSATYARRIGDNPNPTSTGNDQDGTLKKDRYWLQASMPF